jgi:PIN domain nuclease of toxin-antitoxin system
LRLLLDTHTLLWWFSTSPSMSQIARAAIEDEANDVYVSAVSAFEIATKFTIGKLPEGGRLSTNFEEMTQGQNFLLLPISPRDGARGGRLPLHHRYPFDRILIAQAIGLDLTLVSNEKLFDD